VRRTRSQHRITGSRSAEACLTGYNRDVHGTWAHEAAHRFAVPLRGILCCVLPRPSVRDSYWRCWRYPSQASPNQKWQQPNKLHPRSRPYPHPRLPTIRPSSTLPIMEVAAVESDIAPAGTRSP
jgi:hypothetical protein